MKPVNGLLFLCLLSLTTTTTTISTTRNLDNPQPHANLLSSLCKDSEYPDLCFSSLSSKPDVSEATSNNQIEVVALAVASANATNTAFYIKSRLMAEDLEPALEDTLEDCLKNYQDAAEQLQDSLAALLDNAYADVDVWLNAAISATEYCDSALEGRAGNDPELSWRNKIFLKLCKNALMINKKLT